MSNVPSASAARDAAAAATHSSAMHRARASNRVPELMVDATRDTSK